MATKNEILKNRLLLKKYNKILDVEIKENFGYYPSNNTRCDNALDMRNSSINYAREFDPEWYGIYDTYDINDKASETPIF